MRVFLIDNNTIIKYDLPSKIDDSFLITHNSSDNKEYLISFVGIDNSWYMKSNGTVNIIEGANIIDKVKIEAYKKYQVKVVGKEQLLFLYFLPNVENLYKISFNNLSGISIGNNCNINYSSPNITTVVANINKVGDDWVASALDANINVFVNGKKIELLKLKIGDSIFIDGLKIVWMEKFLCVNNPLNHVKINGMSLLTEKVNNYDTQPVSEEEKSVSLYKKEDYFSHVPVMKSLIEEKEVVIDSAPGGESDDKTPFWITLGSSLIMLASSFMMAANIYTNLSAGRGIMSVLPQIIMLVALLFGSVIIPRFTKKYQKKKKKQREQLRQSKYTEYLAGKERELTLYLKDELQILNSRFLSVDNCLTALDKKNAYFWSRQYTDDDFLAIRVGVGKTPSKVNVRAPEKHFSLSEDNLQEMSYQVKDKYLNVEGAPITASLKDNGITSLVVDNSYYEKYVNNIILQLLIMHSSMDLKIAIFTNETSKQRWEYLKYTPHVFSNDKTYRFFATNEEDAKYISNYLEDELKKYRENKDNEEGQKRYIPYYLIIVDDYKNYKGISIINEIVKNRNNIPGFSMLAISNSLKNVPDSSNCFIQVFEKDGVVLNQETGLNSQRIFYNELVNEVNMSNIAFRLFNTPVITDDGTSVLPQSLGFLEMFGVCNIDQLNILNRWSTNNPVISLETTVGVHPNGDRFKIDLHEKYHGPHGLIAGSTGSGKSEFIITFILSMAINYHPNEVQFILIDYKGGGLAGSFFNKETGVKLPHLVGIITNLDSSTMNRSLMSIESEVKRRQVIFNEVRESLGEGTIDIYKYQKLYREGIAKKPMAHLFIICDEFAELKQQQPDFMTQLISISRIGRSLGIHLILSTQKPSGIVNDQIWANSRFKVCLKVQDKNDSMEVLKKPDAASIKEIGRFYLQVGYDELFEIGQSGWSGAKYTPSDKIIIKKDESINYINSVGYSLKTIKEENDNNIVVDYGDELTNIVKYLSDIGIKENIQTKRLWLDPLPSIINITELKNKYSYNPTKNKITPVIGEYDDPVNQVQNILTLDLSDNGNTIIYGSPGSGKDILLTNVIRSCIVEHSPEEVSIYGIDCGSQTLGIFNMFPHVGDIVTIDDEEQIKDLIRMLEKEIDVRKDLLKNYGGNYSDYIANSSKSLPMMVVCINNFDAFEETYEDLIDNLQTVIRDGSKYGIVFVLTAVNTNALKQRMASYFKNIICLHLNDKDDYRIVLNTPRELVPADNYGRGLIAIDESIYEFQTGVFADKKDQVTSLKTLAEEINSKYTNKAKRIPTIPKRVLVDALLKEDYTRDNIPLGYNYENKGLSYFDFRKNRISSIVYANNNSDNMMFITSLVQLIEKNNEVIVLDINKVLDDYLAINHIINNDYDELFSILDDNIKNTKNTKKDIYLIVVGVGNISNVLSDYGMTTFESIVENTNNTSYLHIVLFDQINGYKNIKPSSIGKYIDTNNYIFLGDGIATQSVFSSPNIGFSYKKIDFPCMAYVVKNGKYELIKHVVDGEAIDE